MSISEGSGKSCCWTWPRRCGSRATRGAGRATGGRDGGGPAPELAPLAELVGGRSEGLGRRAGRAGDVRRGRSGAGPARPAPPGGAGRRLLAPACCSRTPTSTWPTGHPRLALLATRYATAGSRALPARPAGGPPDRTLPTAFEGVVLGESIEPAHAAGLLEPAARARPGRGRCGMSSPARRAGSRCRSRCAVRSGHRGRTEGRRVTRTRSTPSGRTWPRPASPWTCRARPALGRCSSSRPSGSTGSCAREHGRGERLFDCPPGRPAPS